MSLAGLFSSLHLAKWGGCQIKHSLHFLINFCLVRYLDRLDKGEETGTVEFQMTMSAAQVAECLERGDRCILVDSLNPNEP
jgi:hypothetical protein